MCDKAEKLFFRLYPTMKKQAETEEGQWLRCCCAISTVVHFCLFVFCMALVGAPSMLLNLFQSAVIYSCYLTLRERELAVYIVLVCGQILQSIFYFVGGEEGESLGAFQTGGGIGNAVACGLLLFANGKAWYAFRMSGGLHGLDVNKPLLEDKDDDGDDEEEAPAPPPKKGKKGKK